MSTIRINTFVAIEPEFTAERQFVATLQVVETDPRTKQPVISVSMNFFGHSVSVVRELAEGWWIAEKARQAKIETNRTATGERFRKKAVGS